MYTGAERSDLSELRLERGAPGRTREQGRRRGRQNDKQRRDEAPDKERRRMQERPRGLPPVRVEAPH
jgi:hypothetical protein